MHIRRPLAALLTALALLGGGASISGCSSTTGSRTGTPADNAKNTSGSDPGGVSQGNLPDNSNRVVTTAANRAGGNGKGEP